MIFTKPHSLLLLLIFSVFLTPVVHAQSVEAMSDFEKATQDYYSRQYDSAVSQYLKLADTHADNGLLLYNIGNSYFKKGDVGRALQYFEKARLLIPREADLKVNLELARKKLSDDVGSSLSDYLVSTFYFWTAWMNQYEYQILLIAVSVLFWGSLLMMLVRRKRFLRLSVVLASVLFVYIASGYILKSELESFGSYAIVTVPELDVRAVYMKTDKPVFKLHAGTRVKITGEQSFGSDQNWLRIELPGGQKGWVPAENLGVI